MSLFIRKSKSIKKSIGSTRSSICEVPHDDRGFTLIELMVVIVISAILMTFGYVRYVDFNRTQKIKGAGLTFINNLRDFQADALAGIKPNSSQCVPPPATNVFTGYEIRPQGGTSYYTRGLCTGGTPGTEVKYDLPSGLQFHTSPVWNPNIRFMGLGQGVTNTVNNIQIRTTGSVTSDTKWYTLCVSTSGEIKDCGYSTGISAPTCVCN